MTTKQLTKLPHATVTQHEHFVRLEAEEGYLFHASHTTTEPVNPAEPDGETTERTVHDYCTSICAPLAATTLADWETVPEADRIPDEEMPEA